MCKTSVGHLGAQKVIVSIIIVLWQWLGVSSVLIVTTISRSIEYLLLLTTLEVRDKESAFLMLFQRQDINKDNASKYRVCSRHFLSGKPAALYDEFNPDWLPTLHLGHRKRVLQSSCIRCVTPDTNVFKRGKELTQKDTACRFVLWYPNACGSRSHCCIWEEGVVVVWESSLCLEVEEALHRRVENAAVIIKYEQVVEDVEIIEDEKWLKIKKWLKMSKWLKSSKQTNSMQKQRQW